MIVVSDASPLHYLVLLDHEKLLPRYYGTVLIPSVVKAELQRPATPEKVRDWIATPPQWLTISDPQVTLPPTKGVHAGELAAVSLALEFHASLLLVDDLSARQFAKRHQVSILGTLGLLARAAKEKLVDFASVINDLQSHGFRFNEKLLQRVKSEFDLK